MRTIKLPCYEMVVELDDTGEAGTIRSALSAAVDENPKDAVNTAMLTSALDAIESLVLACACAGVDIESPAYLEAIETSVNKVFNEYGG